MTALILGKFMPVHAGHVWLIDQARARVGDAGLTVIVGTQPSEPIPGDLRTQWLRELYPRVNVQHLHQAMPQYPHEHPAFWELWLGAIRRLLPTGPDLVFSSETYGDELARRLGAVHVAVDIGRRQVPISATQIRARPWAHWDYLPRVTRPYFVRRVVLYGAESTGKTTLAAELASRFRTVWVPEFARGYLDAKDRSAPLAAFAREDVPRIAAGQVESEERLALDANRVMFCDTDLLTTRIYSELYFGECPEDVVREGMGRRYDLYLALGTGTPAVADSQRHARHRATDVVARFDELLREKGAPFVEISGDWASRRAQAIAAVDGLLR
jgi:HTH-type transcriptional regulator, transcriptional repressor of NAD biosynthesis genes